MKKLKICKKTKAKDILKKLNKAFNAFEKKGYINKDKIIQLNCSYK
jgi:hypothetical protein